MLPSKPLGYARVAMSRAIDPRRVALCVTLSLILMAAWIRLSGLGSQLILLDEAIPVVIASTREFTWIRTNLGLLDHCIPLTLLAKQLIATRGLDEWGLRLPSAIAGVLLLVVAARAGWRRLSPTETILLTASLALSPYLVYLSREARPYAIVMLLFPLSCLIAFAWEAGGGRWRLMLATGLGVVAVWFHPIVLPASGVLALYVLRVWWRDGWRSERTGDLLASAVVLLVLFAVLIWPVVPSYFVQRKLKTGRGQLDSDSLRSALMLLHVTGLRLPTLLWLCIWTLGAYRLFARFPAETVAIAAMLLVQCAFIVLAHPTHTETPWVLFRYAGHLLPFALLLSTLPIAWALQAVAARLERPWLAPALASLLGGMLFATHFYMHRYPIPPYSSYNSHPYMAYLPRDVRASGLMDSTSDFYRVLESGALTDKLIEVPVSINFPIYGVYQRSHRHPVYAGSLDSKGYRSAFTAQGVRLGSVVDLVGDRPVLPEDARYLIYHKRIHDEVTALHEMSKRIPNLRHHLLSDARVKGLLQFEHGTIQAPLPTSIHARFPLIHEDEWVEVYDLRSAPARR